LFLLLCDRGRSNKQFTAVYLQLPKKLQRY
jgi:hypothetical protein